MAKKDGIIKEEEIHGGPEEQKHHTPAENLPEGPQQESDTIKNAHASGLGSIGRSEESRRLDEAEEKY